MTPRLFSSLLFSLLLFLEPLEDLREAGFLKGLSLSEFLSSEKTARFTIDTSSAILFSSSKVRYYVTCLLIRSRTTLPVMPTFLGLASRMRSSTDWSAYLTNLRILRCFDYNFRSFYSMVRVAVLSSALIFSSKVCPMISASSSKRSSRCILSTLFLAYISLFDSR